MDRLNKRAWKCLGCKTPIRYAPERHISYFGSGVTVCHNLLAMKHAGLAAGRLYPGSWSEWVTDPKRLVATGAA